MAVGTRGRNNGSQTIGTQSRLLDRAIPPVKLSEPMVARLGAALLWALVILGVVAGIAAWLRSGSDTARGTASGEGPAGTSTAAVDARWIAAGFAERYVSTYLLAGSDGSSLEQFLGYVPDLPATSQPDDIVAPARAIGVKPAGDEYWSVTVSIGPPGRERFWRAAVDTHGGFPVAVGLPTAVAGPHPAERRDLGVSLRSAPTDDARVATLTGFLGAYLCGQGEVSRYLSPGVVLQTADPPLCSAVEIRRWGVDEVDDSHHTVVVEALLWEGEGQQAVPRQAMYTLSLVERDGRWEIADMPPGPPRKDEG